MTDQSGYTLAEKIGHAYSREFGGIPDDRDWEECIERMALTFREAIDYEAAEAKAIEQEPWAGGSSLGMDSYAKNIVYAALEEEQ